MYTVLYLRKGFGEMYPGTVLPNSYLIKLPVAVNNLSMMPTVFGPIMKKTREGNRGFILY